MNRIQELEQQIRDYVNKDGLYERYFESHLDEWNALCVAMDTLGDTSLALGYYEAFGIGNRDDEKYLKLYGLLQAVFLQQESIRQLNRTFIGNDLNPCPDTDWSKIRELRNLTVGHPIAYTEKGKPGAKHCFISRVTITSGGFQLIIWNESEKQNEFEYVDLKSLYEGYKSEAIKYLKSIRQAQIKKWGTPSNH